MLLDGRLTKYLFLKAKQSEFIFATTWRYVIQGRHLSSIVYKC